MSMRSTALALSLLAVIPGGLAGCGGDETASIKLVPVTGTVTLNNKPFEGARVTFTPDPSNPKSTPGGDITGPDGNYKAMFRNRSGLAPGKYTVLVSKTFLPAGVSRVGAEEDSGMIEESLRDPLGGTGRKAVVASEIRGEFEREVSPAGDIIEFDVKAKAKAISPSNP
jgi:hypothetical protein